MAKKIKSLLLIVLATVLLFVGCGNKSVPQEAEGIVKTFFTALPGLNTDVMNACISEGDVKDFGIDTSLFSKEAQGTETYKNSVQNMMKSMCATIEYTVNSSEFIDKNKVAVNVTLKHADSNEEAVNEYIDYRIDNYMKKYPVFNSKTESEQNEILIQVIENAYITFLNNHEKVTKDINVVVECKNDKWKIVNSDDNSEIKSFLSDILRVY